LRCHALPIGFLADVETQVTRRRAERACDFAAQRVVDIGDVDERAVRGEHARDRFADAACGTRDEGDLAVQSTHVRLRSGDRTPVAVAAPYVDCQLSRTA